MNYQDYSFLNRSFEWVVLVVVLCAYIILRAKQLHWAERMLTGLLSAGLAFAFTEEVSGFLGGRELTAAVLIMLIGPAILNAMLTFGENKEFINGLLEAWARKKLGVNENESSDEK